MNLMGNPFYVIGNSMENILVGCKVINLAYNLPGPIAAHELAKFGAKVTKIEPPGGDPFKRFCLEWYEALITGQEIFQLNLKTSEGWTQFNGFLSGADILITSVRPSALKRLGLGWDVIGAKYPRLSHVEIIGYSSPGEEKPGHDLTYQAEGGLLSPPSLPRSLYADLFGAQKVVQAVLLLMIQRLATGKGAHMRISLSEGVEALSSPENYGLTGDGNFLGGGMVRYNLYQTKNGWIALAALEDKFWIKFLSLLGLTNDKITKEILDSIFIQKETEDWVKWANENELPISEVR